MEKSTQQSSAVRSGSGQESRGYFKNKFARIKAMTGRDWLNWFLDNTIYFVVGIFIIITIIYSQVIIRKSFLDLKSFVEIVKGVSSSMFLALGVGGIIILTGTDLSAGRIMGLTAFLSVALLQKTTQPNRLFSGMGIGMGPLTGYVGIFGIVLALIIAMGVGGFIGSFNGFFVAKFKLNPFIVTIAVQTILIGVILFFSKMGTTQGIVDEYRWSSTRNNIMLTDTIGLPLYVIYAVVATLITWFMWNYTTFGKKMYAVGSNPEAANISGINVSKTIILVFLFAGLLYGFSGWVEGGNTISPTASTGMNMELDAIAACVIGGVSFTGGIGKIRGIVFGVIILQLINYCVGLYFTQQYMKDIIRGVVILFAVTVDMRKYLVKR